MSPTSQFPGLGLTTGAVRTAVRSAGLTATAEGPRLRVFSRHASSVELCLLDESGAVTANGHLERDDNGIWQIVDQRLQPGQRYALRVDGPDGPGDRFVPGRTFLDPYARAVEQLGDPRGARWVSVVTAEGAGVAAPFDWGSSEHPATPLRDTVIYEAHVRGLTQQAPWLPPELRGTYAGLGHPETIAHMKRLGVTAVELLPIQAFASERHLRRRGLTNFWGYNTIAFFAPHAPFATERARQAGPDAVIRELKGMVRLLHEAGLEVIMDVVYNHTADEGEDGEPVMLRGIDNAYFYRTDERGRFIDTTGCGNSLDTSRHFARTLVLDSLRYWVREFHVDGFRFDLAAELGRNGSHSFDTGHPLLNDIVDDSQLADAKIIAEPWDVGMGGWQTGNFPVGWSEWNDRFRDRARRFWVSDFGEARRSGRHPQGLDNIATALAGSSDLFSEARGPLASVNFVTAHDGFTLRDLVSYNVKHNLLNGELGRDGSSDNKSYNFGIEGETGDARIGADRRLAIRNLLGTLFLAAGVPMLLAGDEFGETRRGNNNPYNQDGPIGWLDWNRESWQDELTAQVALLARIRAEHPALRPGAYNHTDTLAAHATRLRWFSPLGTPMESWEWRTPELRSVQYVAAALVRRDGKPDELDELLVLVHGVEDDGLFTLPDDDGAAEYRLLWDSVVEHAGDLEHADDVVLPGATLRVSGPSIRIYEVRPAPGRRPLAGTAH